MTAKDIISRGALKCLTTDLARHLLALDAEAVELLETQNQRIEDRRADLVARMRSTDGQEFLLHIEIANDNKANMPLRMLWYCTDICFSGHRGLIRQFLIYIGVDRLTMPAGLDEPGLLDYHYGLVDMHRVDDYMNMLEILSENRDLRAQIEEAEHMLTQVDIERLPSFAIGFEQGEKKDREKGKAQLVHRLLSRLGATEVSELVGLAPEDVERIAEKRGDADSARNRH